MLEALQVSRHPDKRDSDARSHIESVSFATSSAQVTVVVGARGSGKHSLLEVLAGARRPDQGALLFHGRDLTRQPLHANELGVVIPGAADSLPGGLTVRETLASSLLLRVRGLSREEIQSRLLNLLTLCGLETLAAEHVAGLSPVQHRRLLLACALVSDPVLVLCQDFTFDMDAKAERELVALLKLVATDVPGRVVLNFTSSLTQLPAYDSAVVLHEGHVCFHGPARAISHYFNIKSVENLYPRLAMRPAARWGESWMRHRDSYYDAFKMGASAESLATAQAEGGDDDSGERVRLPEQPSDTPDEEDAAAAPPPAAGSGQPGPTLPSPGLFAQAALLARRRWLLLRRSRTEWRLQAFFLVSLPLLAVLLIWPNRAYLNAAMAAKTALPSPEMLWPAAFTCLMAVFLQVLLVLYIALRNGAREIARERTLIDREFFAGVRPLALLLSKTAYLFPLVLGQTLWLGFFVEMLTGGIPGPLWLRLSLLSLCALSFTAICLAISAHSATSGRAQYRCLTLAFVQVLLAGALLGMPQVLGGVVYPFITAYHAWSGIVAGMVSNPVHEAIDALLSTRFAAPSEALGGLVLHLLLGLLAAYLGLRRARLR